MTRWRHPHSIAAGLLAGVYIAGHGWLLLACFALVLLAGIGVGRAWGFLVLMEDALRHRWHLARRERIRTRPEPVYDLRSKKKPGGFPEGY